MQVVTSIITPSHNSAQFISATIQSVLNQSISDWELIIVDDCSSDNSVEVIHSFVERDSRIKLIQLSENSGAAVARNRAIEVAQGRYIAFLDSDDLWLPEKLEKQLAFMQANNYPFTYAAYDNLAKKLGCNESISFIGHISHSKLLEIMAETQFFLLLSRYRGERLPNVLKEAMYRHCVVITSDTEGISHYFT